MDVSPLHKIIPRLLGILGTGRLIILVLLASPFPLRSEENTPHPLLAKEPFENFTRQAGEVYDATIKLRGNLDFSNLDERVLLHLPRRGFPFLVALVEPSNLHTYVGSTVFMPEIKLQTLSAEEDIAGDLLNQALATRVMANRSACFRLLKELALSPEALRLEKQAKELLEKIESKADAYTECSSLETLESIRALFDQLKGLPQMTPEQFAHERAESAVLAPAEYLDDDSSTDQPKRKKWPDQCLDRQRKWDHEGYLLTYGECTNALDYQRFQMVVNRQGGIFEAEQEYNGSHFNPSSYESKLPPSELPTLEKFLAGMPESDASGDEIHFIVSFSKDGNWVTRTYRSLPTENPFQPLLRRMIQQSARAWGGDRSQSAEFLAPAP